MLNFNTTQAMNALLDDATLESKGVNAENFTDLYEFNFTYSCADESVVELIEGGLQTPVTYVDNMVMSI